MKTQTHPYKPNGLRMLDENGNLRCWCGFLESQHVTSGEERTPERPRVGRSRGVKGDPDWKAEIE